MSARDYVLTVTDGTTTVTLTASPFGLLDYVPNPPEPEAVASLDDSATVSETCVIRLLDGSAANNSDEVRTLQRLLDQGRKAQKDPALARVYLTFKEAAAGTEYRSEIVRGLAEYDEKVLGRAQWGGNAAKVKLFWERVWFFEATTAVQLPVSNQSVTDNTSGAPVHNPRVVAGALNNYIEIAAAQVTGVVNAPVRLELTNNSGGVVTYKDIHVGVSHMVDIANFAFTLEAEAGSGGAPVANAAASGGSYITNTWADSTETAIWSHPLTSAVLSAARGAYFLPLIRLQGGTIDATYKLRLNVTLSGVTVYRGTQVTLTASNQLQPLGIIQLPPHMERLIPSKSLTLTLIAQRTGGGTLNLDYVHLMPLGSYRHLRQLAYAVPVANTLYVDELFDKRGMVYAGDSGGGYYRAWVERGTKLTLQPNTKQRIYILFDESGGLSNIGREFTVKLYYRPRRLSI